MRSPVFVRNHMAVLTELAARGHAVDVAFEGLKEGAGTLQTAPIERLAAGEGRIGVAAAPVPHGPRALIRRRALVASTRHRSGTDVADGHVRIRRSARGTRGGLLRP